MSKWFNTAGPCKADLHYMLPPVARLPQLKRLIDQQCYFIIHAPRQVGKTTTMLALAQELTASGRYAAVMVSAEVGAAFPDQVDRAERAILDSWMDYIDRWLPPSLHPPAMPAVGEGQRVASFLKTWAKALAPMPLVVFIDEIDSLQNQTLISVLRQLRSGYPNRPEAFPHSLALIGMRDVRDYKLASGGSDRLHTASPFNIKVESFTLGNFSFEDVKTLYGQHTQATGQIFTADALARAYHLTDGQPWLVNALARQATEFLVTDISQPITVETIDAAKEILIRRQDTHLDSLAERLREPRVQAIIEPILGGQDLPDVPEDDLRYVIDLGLCRNGECGLEIANPVYREVLPRVLSSTSRASIGRIEPEWLSSSGELLPTQLLQSFLSFWRQHGEPLFRSTPYPEIAPHLVLMAFLHRVVNGGGTLEREYAIGSGRMDLCLRYGKVTLGMELKVWRDGQVDPLKQGLIQLDTYLSGLGLNVGWLVIFDRRSDLPPVAERTGSEYTISPAGRVITLIRA